MYDGRNRRGGPTGRLSHFAVWPTTPASLVRPILVIHAVVRRRAALGARAEARLTGMFSDCDPHLADVVGVVAPLEHVAEPLRIDRRARLAPLGRDRAM